MVGIPLPPAAINDGPPVTPRPSATVLLVRAGDPWELLLMRRPGGADFAPGAYVFPGGSVHAEDAAWPDDIRAAGVRELFEEVGILLARRSGRVARDADCRAVRSAVEGGATFTSALRGRGLEPAFDRLVLLTRWVTPSRLSRRFDTRFFLARLPRGQTIKAQEGEVTDWLWVSPRRALDEGALTLVYATRAVLESVADEPSTSRLIARARRLREVPVVEPRLVETESGWQVVR
jgi:8-oxo-dGTP pyrophosphatase MutT (NUDIX family)